MPSNLFERLRTELAPDERVRARVKRRMSSNLRQRMSVPIAFAKTHRALSPRAEARQAIWSTVLRRIDAGSVLSLFEHVRRLLVPAAQTHRTVREHLLARLVDGHASVWPFRLKWAAAIAAIAVVFRVSPFLFIAPPTVAHSDVTLLPTRGEVYVSMGDLWQPVQGELTLEPGMRLKTGDGEASILFHDDGVIRLDRDTIVTLHDTQHRLGLAPDVLPTMTLYAGRVWVQGLVPPHVRGLTVSTSYGYVTVNEGSVAITEDDVVDVRVFDRRTVVGHDGQDIVLVAGERTQIWDGNVPLVKKLASSEYHRDWYGQNIARDAVHRREIAQLQQERRAAVAGILPTSALYPVKRIAETVDVFLTIDADSRTQKRIEQANTRLNEAAALIGSDLQDAAAVPLAEYRAILVALAEGGDRDALTQFLLQQALAINSSDVAAALPNDDAYPLKQAVLEASAAVDGITAADAIAGIIIVDTLTALQQNIEQGEFETLQEAWNGLQPHLAILEGDALPADVQKEILALLSHFAGAVREHQTQIGLEDSTFLTQVLAHAPVEAAPVVLSLSDDDVAAIAQAIRDRIFVYHMKQSRLNQLVTEIRAIDGHPDEGRILRKLYLVLPDGPEGFPDRIRKEITRLRWDQEVNVL